ncbi:MAG: alanine/glycine:cation symporter family protein [Alphaproteobacteria bacterium]
MESSQDGLLGFVNPIFEFIVGAMSAVLFLDIGGFPFIVLWLVAAALFFTVYLRGVNFRLFRHAFHVVTGKHGDKDEAHGKGEISHLQALFSAIAATVGLGSIAGVSVAVAVGGPGVVFWIVVAGMLGMATKFAEVTLSLQYREVDASGKVFGGPFQYIKKGLANKGMAGLGKFLAVVFAIFCLGGALGGGNMFQSNQVVKIFTHVFPSLETFKWLLAAGFAALVFLVLIGSIQRVAKVAEMISPLKGIVYLITAIIIVGANIDKLGDTIALIFSEAFTGQAAAGGFIGMIAMAFKRASFANEAGLGSAPIAYATTKTQEPISEASVALLEPFFAAMIGVLTGLIVTITGAYAGGSLEDGALITLAAFETVAPWFSIMLAVNILIFAYSTTIGWSYYGEIAWSYLFGRRGIRLYQLIFAGATFLGGIMSFGIVLDLSDLFILGMALPNLIAVFMLRKQIRDAMDAYIAKLK